MSTTLDSSPVTISASICRRFTVTADDGVELAVREFGARSASTTVVLLHGHTMRSESWAFVRTHLLRTADGGPENRPRNEGGSEGPTVRAAGTADLRVIAYDHRGHGHSSAGATGSYRIDQLARDLRAVLDACAGGPVILAGHSMGAMTILSFARQFPAYIGERISGVALVAGAAGGLTGAGMGQLLTNPVVDAVHRAALRVPGLVAAAKTTAARAVGRLARRRPGNRRWATIAGVLANQTSIEAVAGFLGSFATFDEIETLPVFAAVPTVVVFGTEDHVTPQEFSLSMASRIPGARLRPVLDAGHGLIVEHPHAVAAAVRSLFD